MFFLQYIPRYPRVVESRATYFRGDLFLATELPARINQLTAALVPLWRVRPQESF